MYAISHPLFSSYFRFHGLKIQVIVLPNGMIAHIFITSLVQSDLGVWNMSGVGPELVRLLRNSVRQNGLFAALYGDGIFTPHLCLVPRYRNPNDRELRINMRFAPPSCVCRTHVSRLSKHLSLLQQLCEDETSFRWRDGDAYNGGWFFRS